MEKLEEFFKLKERGTSVKIEVLAGITTFMTMAYVLVVQPGAIIGFGDAVSFTDINGLVITKEAIAVTCAVISALITLLMGFYANLPFALATGMGTNFMFGALLQSNTPVAWRHHGHNPDIRPDFCGFNHIRGKGFDCQGHTQKHKGGHWVGNRFLHCLPGL
ncbi:MAG: hypothetical protein ACLTW9_15310 [Enterocloster sp.]